MESNKILPKFCYKFYCEKCDYGTCKKSSYNDHLTSAKHLKSINGNEILPKICSEFICQKCSKKYKDNSGLWRHKKKCNNLNEQKQSQSEEKDLTDKNIIKMLIKENSEFKNMILEVVKSVQPNNTTNNNTTNNTTNNFNLQFFLNETCKDAINLVDFVKSLQVQLVDLEETARLGYTEGVSKIFINGLNKLDVCKRPIHCSDAKRETLYIKDQDEWTKEDTNKTHLTKAIKTVANKNIQQIFEWQKKYPEYNDPESKQSDKYMEMICNTMSGSSIEEQEKNMNKIIKNITKEVVIDKTI
jgi:hypothetical protein